LPLEETTGICRLIADALLSVLQRNGTGPLLAFCDGVALTVIAWLDAAEGGGGCGAVFDES